MATKNKMTLLPNFYENLKESTMRLKGTIVLYDGSPYYVGAITNHMGDGIFRVYLEPIDQMQKMLFHYDFDIPSRKYNPDSIELGPRMDEFIQNKKDCKILRKMMNSPLFDKFRPYPLGMLNSPSGEVLYLNRRPNRKSEQGLIESMVDSYYVSIQHNLMQPDGYIGVWSVYNHPEAFVNTVKNLYPSKEEAFDLVSNLNYKNTAVAFSRNFAFVRGPVGTVFLWYKQWLIGQVTGKWVVNLAGDFQHLREILQEETGFYITN